MTVSWAWIGIFSSKTIIKNWFPDPVHTSPHTTETIYQIILFWCAFCRKMYFCTQEVLKTNLNIYILPWQPVSHQPTLWKIIGWCNNSLTAPVIEGGSVIGIKTSCVTMKMFAVCNYFCVSSLNFCIFSISEVNCFLRILQIQKIVQNKHFLVRWVSEKIEKLPSHRIRCDLQMMG